MGGLVAAMVEDRIGGEYDSGPRSTDRGLAQLNRGIKNVMVNKSSNDFKNCKLKISSRIMKLIGV